ncbi:MAG: bifunctional 5,10-methylenetetrahydrofolate dehydrogenase/5,10-methenyltetrahydrofolate cyclohydrolase [Patescibacteria group bacterium]
MQLIDGRLAKAHYLAPLLERVKALPYIPCLVIIQVGTRPDSDVYIRAKKLMAQKIGVKEIHLELPESVTQEEIISLVEKYNKDETVQGLIVQLPVPAHLDSKAIIEAIDTNKEVDGYKGALIPATARGVRELLDFYNIDLSGKKVTMVGSSELVGKPIATMAEKAGAIVALCNSKTADLKSSTLDADILIIAIGKPYFITREYTHEKQIVIDVGITRTENGRVVGDVDFENVAEHVAMITPVPGGVGQMTVLALFENLIDACYSNE